MASAHFMFLGKSVPALETACLLLFVGADGQVGPARPAHLAAGRDGGPDPRSPP
jgi:hypothetical protein